jgi:acyl-CoA thioesterase
MTSFSDLLAAIARAGDSFVTRVSDDWLQGRTLYGGLAGALCVEAALRRFDGLPPLCSAQFAFVGPATGQLRIRPMLLRQGKSTAFVAVDLEGEAGLATRATLCFGAARASQLAHAAPPAAPVPPPENCEDFFRHAPPGLGFAQHFDGRLAAGAMPFSRAGAPDVMLWLRHRDAALKPSIVALLALADASPPASFVLFEKPAPISTMTWSLDVLAGELATDDGWWLVRSAADHVADGYSGQTMGIWNARGAPVALARQNVAVFI